MRNALSGIVVAGLMFFCITACHAAEPKELAADWSKDFLRRWCEPVSVPGPVASVWEQGQWNAGELKIVPGKGCVLVINKVVPHKITCVELSTGKPRWETSDWREVLLVTENIVFAQQLKLPEGEHARPKGDMQEIWGLLSITNGTLLNKLESKVSGFPNMPDLVKLRKRMQAAKNPQMPVIEDSRNLLRQTLYSENPAKSLPSGKPDNLTQPQVKQILDAVKADGLPHHGTGKGFVIPNAKRVLLMGFSGDLQLYEDLSKDPIWSVNLSQSPDPRLAYTDDLCLAVGDGYKITAVHTDTGKTAWEYEAEVKGVYGAPTRELVVLEDGFLFFTDPLEEPEDANTRNIAMTKLDKNGRVQFQQSLPSQAHYPKIYFSGQYLLIQSGGHVACYRSKSKQAVKPAE